MDANALTVLEFPAIAERLAGAAGSERGAELALALEPSSDPDEVARRQALTAEAVALLDEAAEPPLHGIHDVRTAAAHAARGGVLTAEALARVASTVAGGLRARAALEEQREAAPLLGERAAEIDRGLAALADEIRRCVEDDGSDLRDTASPLLRRLRKELRAGRARVADELRRLARAPGLREHLQEDFVTERGGRPVLAVKASSRSSVRGIVHDASGSGQTLFVEPFEVVELNNRQSEAAAEEREEVERILRELSAAVGGRAAVLEALVEATGAIDLALACGALSRGWRGAPVEPSEEIRLLAGRHPLLDPAVAVPIDLDLGALRALVISGPNAGGKTVALKTLGLAALLHQSGLRPAAETAALPVFDRVLADIGDQQSIEMSLSTFSAHVRNLVAILESATERSLVLVDELASGTDPVEGSALAQALLHRLAGQARLAVVTTHYPELKEWASATDGAANAATAIDPDTHEPLYRIALDRPGTSHALQIAGRLGLDAAVLEDARGRIAPERLRVSELLAEAEAAERATAEEREAAERARAEARDAVERAHEREAALQSEIERVRASAARERELAAVEAQRDLAAARAELSALREEIRVARRRDREAQRLARKQAARAEPAAASRAERERDRRLGAASTRAARAERELRALEEPLPVLAPLAVGDPVEAPGVGVRGTIAAIDGDEAEVVGVTGQRVRIALSRLRPDAQRHAPAEEPSVVRVLAVARGDVSDELDVRGRSAQEAREAVRAFVDDAALAGLRSVRIVHGRGTGVVRKAVRDELARHPLVGPTESDSADGATVASLD
ncbi:MAG TPA: Smr/MutS family protein [Gaiellaceae bacterium]|nr:Smr/MutS family protein [Gaiellaceae bacterium]